MRILIAWTLTLALGASVVAIGRAQGIRGSQGQVGDPVMSPVPHAGPTAARPSATRGPPRPGGTSRPRQAPSARRRREAMIPMLAEWEKQSKKVTNLVGRIRADRLVDGLGR